MIFLICTVSRWHPPTITHKWVWQGWLACAGESPSGQHRDITQCPANTKHWSNVSLMLGQRRRWWTSVQAAFVQRFTCVDRHLDDQSSWQHYLMRGDHIWMRINSKRHVLANGDLMLGHRRRRWTSIKSALGHGTSEWRAGLYNVGAMLSPCFQ